MVKKNERVTPNICSYCRIEEKLEEETNINDFIWLNISDRLTNLCFDCADAVKKKYVKDSLDEDNNEK